MNTIQQIQSPEIQGKVYAACFKLTKDHEKAAELRQDVMYFAIRSIHLYKEEGKLIHWLRMITRNTFINKYRKEKNRKEVQPFEWVEMVEENKGLYSQDVEIIWKSISTLPRKQREALRLVVEGYQYDEIAEMQNCAMGTIKSRIFHARRELAQKLGIEI